MADRVVTPHEGVSPFGRGSSAPIDAPLRRHIISRSMLPPIGA
jgi:hypothetical protein